MDRERGKRGELGEHGKVGMDRINKLVKGIMSISYRVRQQRIMEFVVECLEDEILKMESLFEKIKEEGSEKRR
jgi:chlorite dismutase